DVVRSAQPCPGGRKVTLFLTTHVPLDTRFEPRTRNEIRSVTWHPVEQLQVPGWLVQDALVLEGVVRWIRARKSNRSIPSNNRRTPAPASAHATPATLATLDPKR